VWSVPVENIEAVKGAASKHGVGVDQLDADWNHVFRLAPAGIKLNEQQEAIMKHVSASKATIGIGIVASPAPAMVEYALTRDATAKDSARDPASIVLALNASTHVTLTRTSVEIRPDMCVWRGAVDATDAPVTILWWPGGKMVGMIQHAGHIFSIRHIGGDMHVIIETSEDRMPQEHAPGPPRTRVDDPNLRDEPPG
jgi:hypothetical protein